jgi:hypothetical protein
MMSQQVQPLELKYHRLELTNRWLVGITAVVLVALIALAGYSVANRTTPPNYTDRATAAMMALNGTDLDAFLALYAPDAQIVTPTGTGQGQATLTASFNEMRKGATVLTRVSDVASAGHTATYDFTWTSPVGGSGAGTEILVFDDAGKIVYEVAFLR